MLVKQLGARRVGNLFVHLRKIAQHPLLVRHHYDDDRLGQLARLLHRRCLPWTHIATPVPVLYSLCPSL